MVRFFVVGLLAVALGGCGSDGSDTKKDGDTGSDTTADSSATCVGTTPICTNCAGDGRHQAKCIGGTWTCPRGFTSKPCKFEDYPSCKLYGGEVCCDAKGNATDARCPTPLQPLCKAMTVLCRSLWTYPMLAR